MTPKEKAEDLIMKFSNPFAKSSAMILVNEILSIKFHYFDEKQFWNEVKKELEKL